jgi:tRNA (cmo5U34)-methyltransferase
MKPLHQKSTPDQIRQRFDNDVQRFTHLETGQTATIDAPLAMELITPAAVAATPRIERVLDIGCGAGNNTLKLREVYDRDFESHLLDLSQPMIDKAVERVSGANRGKVIAYQGDFREVELSGESFDVVLAAAVLHHLRDDKDWEAAFAKIYRILTPGGSVWITDLVWHESAAVQQLMWQRYGEYLAALGGTDYRDQVFAYIDVEDSPRPVTYQLDLLRKVGFSQVDILHKSSTFAAFGAVKA